MKEAAQAFIDRVAAWMLTQPEPVALSGATFLVNELQALQDALMSSGWSSVEERLP